MNQKGSIFGIAVIIIILLIVASLSLGRLFNRNETVSENNPLSTSLLPTPSSTPSLLAVTNSKKLFTPESKFFMNKPYPEDLLSMNEDQLISIRCNRPSRKDTEAYKPNPDLAEITDLNKVQMDIVDKLNNLNPNSQIFSFTLCQDYEGSYYLLSGVEASKTLPYPIKSKLVTLNKKLDILDSFDIPFNSYYSHCSTALLLTEDKHLFIQCTEADGQYGISSIYDLDLSLKDIKLNASCNTKLAAGNEQSDGTGSRVECSSAI